MPNLKKIAASFSLVILIIAVSSFTVSLVTSSTENKWLPKDFHPKDVILLVETHPYNEKQNDRMLEFLGKEYKWRYEVASFEQMQQNEKYKDKKLYQFALLWTDKESRKIDPGSRLVYHDIDGHFLDRNTGTEYPNSELGNGYGQIGYRKVFTYISKHFKDSE